MRERVIDAAITCFARDGIAGTTLGTVATTAGVHRVTLHRAFPGGRAELMIGVLNRVAGELAGEWIRDDLEAVVLVDHWTRIVLSLATNPVSVAKPADVHRYLDTFVTPALIRPQA